MKLLEENIGTKHTDMSLVNDILKMTQKAQAINSKINKQDYTKLKTEETMNKVKRQHIQWEKNICKRINGQRINIQNI